VLADAVLADAVLADMGRLNPPALGTLRREHLHDKNTF